MKVSGRKLQCLSLGGSVDTLGFSTSSQSPLAASKEGVLTSASHKGPVLEH